MKRFFKLNSSHYEEKVVREYKASKELKTKVVVDGPALLLHILSAPGLVDRGVEKRIGRREEREKRERERRERVVCGGQYAEVEEDMALFFSALRQGGLSPFVLLDGVTRGTEVRKSICESAFRYIHNTTADHLHDKEHAPYYYHQHMSTTTTVLPPALVHQVYVQVMRKMDVPYAVCDREAGEEVVRYAVQHGCAFMGSNLSTLFTCKGSAGYIPLDTITFDQLQLSFSVYTQERLCKRLGLDAQMLPLLAVLCGDKSRKLFWPINYLLKQIRELEPASEMARMGMFLRGFNTLEDALRAAYTAYEDGIEVFRKEYMPYEFGRDEEGSTKVEDEQEASTSSEVTSINTESEVADENNSVEQTGSEQEVTTDEDDDYEEEDIFSMDPTARQEHFWRLMNVQIRKYRVVERNVLIRDKTSLKLHCDIAKKNNNYRVNIPLPVLQLYRQNLFPASLLDVLCHLQSVLPIMSDDTDQCSCLHLSLPIRKFAYGVLLAGAPSKASKNGSIMVIERVREGLDLIDLKVEPMFIVDGRELPAFNALITSPPHVRQSLFLEINQSNTPTILALPQEWILPIVMLRSFVTAKKLLRSPLTEQEFLSLLLCMVSEFTAHKPREVRRQDLQFLGEWHGTIYSILLLHSALLNPLPMPRISMLYDGYTLSHYLKSPNRIRISVQMLNQSKTELLNKLLSAFADIIEVQLDSFGRDSQGTYIDSAKPAIEVEDKLATENRFQAFADLVEEGEQTSERQALPQKQKKKKKRIAKERENTQEIPHILEKNDRSKSTQEYKSRGDSHFAEYWTPYYAHSAEPPAERAAHLME